VEHRAGTLHAKANGVTYEASVPATHEVYVSLSDSTRFRAPTITLSHRGGVDIEEVDASEIATVPFEALTGLKAFVVSNALQDLGAPREIVSPLVQNLPKLWDLFHNYGMQLLELNPIRMAPGPGGRLVPVACDFKAEFDQDDPRVDRLGLPPEIFATGYTPFEQEVNELRTYQGQSDVYVINPEGDLLPLTFGGGANSLVTELLGDDASISSDFGGNPPYEKMRAVAEICLRHFRLQSNVLFVIGGKANNTDIHVTFRAIADALRDDFGKRGPSPLYVVAGRGGPQVVRGMGALRDTCEALGLPYCFFGFDSDMSGVVDYARDLNRWMRNGGRQALAREMGIAETPTASTSTR
jgi:succinyl-CoA synthetase beta subunit